MAPILWDVQLLSLLTLLASVESGDEYSVSLSSAAEPL